jgi:hypothetical protein
VASIRDLFADPDLAEEGGDDVQIDIDKVLSEVTNVLNDRPPTPDSPPRPPVTAVSEGGETPPPDEVTTSDEHDSEGTPVVAGGEEDESEEEESDAAPLSDRLQVHPVLGDPWLELPAERRAAILALDQTLMADETKRAKVFGILSGDTDAPPTPTVATLPEHIDPESFEATLWREQQEQRTVLERMAEQNRAVQAETQRQSAQTAAMQAGNRFAQKYADKLTQDDILEIAKFAGMAGTAGAFANTAEAKADPSAAFEQALEHTLWTNESFRARVLGTSGPVTPPGEQPEAQERKRKLSALSSSASPVSGPSPRRSPLEAGVDGKLTEKSRQDLVKDAANMLRRQNEGAF